MSFLFFFIHTFFCTRFILECSLSGRPVVVRIYPASPRLMPFFFFGRALGFGSIKFRISPIIIGSSPLYSHALSRALFARRKKRQKSVLVYFVYIFFGVRIPELAPTGTLEPPVEFNHRGTVVCNRLQAFGSWRPPGTLQLAELVAWMDT